MEIHLVDSPPRPRIPECDSGCGNIWVTLGVSAVVLADGVMIMMPEQRNTEKR